MDYIYDTVDFCSSDVKVLVIVLVIDNQVPVLVLTLDTQVLALDTPVLTLDT